MIKNSDRKLDPRYARTVLIPLCLTTIAELISAVIFWLVLPSLRVISVPLIFIWVGLFIFFTYRKLFYPPTRDRYIARWEAEGRPTCYGAVPDSLPK